MDGNSAANINIILVFGLVLVFGYVGGKIANLIKLPKVTGYIVVGILLEPSFLGILPEKLIAHSTVISNFALCVITYAIGGSLLFSHIKSLGKTIPVMTLLESEITFFAVTAGIFFALPFVSKVTSIPIPPAAYFPFALLAGALAAPTDPTPTLAVKEEYKADGPVTTTILGIGAFDDALGIINFSIAISIGAAFIGGCEGGLCQALTSPLIQIALSVGLGLVCAVLLLLVTRKVEDRGVLIALILGVLFTCFGTAQRFNLDELMSTMVMGCAVVNLAKDKEKFFADIRDEIEEMVFIVFFVLAGAQLQLGVLKSALVMVVVFCILRVTGKFAGAFLGAAISGAQPNVRKYSSFGLIPQGGIVVGLALLVKQDAVFKDISLLLLNLILGTTVLFEFLGPLFTEVALKKSKEVFCSAEK